MRLPSRKDQWTKNSSSQQTSRSKTSCTLTHKILLEVCYHHCISDNWIMEFLGSIYSLLVGTNLAIQVSRNGMPRVSTMTIQNWSDHYKTPSSLTTWMIVKLWQQERYLLLFLSVPPIKRCKELWVFLKGRAQAIITFVKYTILQVPFTLKVLTTTSGLNN